ncbi:MAG: class I SAM-dependent methyltransferase [Hyphomicrobiaceae bacterium]
MSPRSHGLTEAFHAYMLSEMVAVPPAVERLAAAADKLPERNMRMAAEQGRFMAFLIEIIGAREVIEVGTFVGYGTLWMASALPPNGRLVTLDIDARYPEIGRPFWREAGVESRIDLRIAPALSSLDRLRREGGDGRFDMAFIDADKSNYVAYYEHCLALIRPGGLILIDNVFWGGDVADPANTTADTQAIRAVVATVMGDRRVSAATIPIGDGLTLVRKSQMPETD